MKKGILILLGMFVMVSTVEAKNGHELPTKDGFNYSYDKAVNFEEKGIEFFVFTNGEFDFNSLYNDSYYDYNGSRIRTERNLNINRDYRGRINRIGASYIYYDNYGNVSRIGNVYMRYYRGRLTNVGNLKIRYDFWGNPTFYGSVKDNYYQHNGISINLNIGSIFNYDHSYFKHRDFYRNYSKIREDSRYYYYKANKNAKIGNRSQILRRRKPTVKSNNTYRKPVIVKKKEVTIHRNNSNVKRPTSTATTRKTTTGRKTNSVVTKKPVKVTTQKRSNNTVTRKPVVSKKTKTTVTRKNVVKRDQKEKGRRN